MTADVNGDPGRGLAEPAPIPDEPTVAVTLGDGVAELAASEGGVIYLSLRESRCCSGTLTFLDASTSLRSSRPALRSWSIEGVDVQLVTPVRRFPQEITIEQRGRRRRKLVAYLDGCAYRL